MLNAQFTMHNWVSEAFDRNKNLQKSNINGLNVFTVAHYYGVFEDFCSHFNFFCTDLGVAGAPGAGVFPFSLYSNHLSGKSHL